ncbi:MAG: hypothetical protein R3B48_29870 [Kofleriaceae bacterium]
MLDAVLHHLVTAAPTPAPCDGVSTWWRGHLACTAPFTAPIERAIVAGFAADRPAWAFASGYQEALARLVPALAGTRGAMCATEDQGAHPSTIKTALAGGRVTGDKRFVTLAGEVEQLLVVASLGEDAAGRNRLTVVRLPATRAGITFGAMGPSPFVPELPMGTLRLAQVQVEDGEQLPGDGYDTFLKPFRTVEDLHVHAALLGWIFQVGRRAAWPRDLLERLLAELSCLAALAPGDPSEPAVHLALGGVLTHSHRLLADLEPHWAAADAASRERWLRDRVVLSVAGKARAQRLEVAWGRVSGARPASD